MTAFFACTLLLTVIGVPVIGRTAHFLRIRGINRAVAELDRQGALVGYRDLSYPELGFLLGGPNRALLAGIAEAATRPGPRHTLSGFLAPRLHDPEVSMKHLRAEAEPHLRQITDRLEQLRLKVPGSVGSSYSGLCTAATLVCWALGVVFMAACSAYLVQQGLGVLEVLFVVVVISVWIWAWTPERRPPLRHTAAAERITAAVKDDLDYLDPRQKPAYSSYGPWAPLLAAAVFGPPAFLLAFPELADKPLAHEVMVAGAAGTSGTGAGCSTAGCGTDSEACSSSGCSSSGCSSSGCSSSGCGGGGD